MKLPILSRTLVEVDMSKVHEIMNKTIPTQAKMQFENLSSSDREEENCQIINQEIFVDLVIVNTYRPTH